MFTKRNDRRENYQHRIGEDQIRSLVEELGLEISSETSTHYLCYCVFHSNSHSSAATISKENAYYYCFGAGCGVHMSIVDLVQEIRQCDIFPALRFIKKFESESNVAKEIEDIFAAPEDLPRFDNDLIEQYKIDFWKDKEAQRYIAGRGIKRATADFFNIGYIKDKRRIVTPMYDTDGHCVGYIGRQLDYKAFKNSFNLPTSKTLWNYNNAKKSSSDALVLVEANFDGIRAHQSGYPNVVACLGGSFTDYHLTQITRSFSKLIIATDNDDAGHKFAKRIAKQCQKRRFPVHRIQYSGTEILPHNAKDFGDCADIEIAQAIRNSEPFVV